MTKVMRATLLTRLSAHYSEGAGDSMAERVVGRLLDKALAGDVTAIQFVFAAADDNSAECGSKAPRPLIGIIDPGAAKPWPLEPAGRPLVDVIDPEEE